MDVYINLSDLERKLRDMLERAETAVDDATKAAKSHATALIEHAKLLRTAVEDPNVRFRCFFHFL